MHVIASVLYKHVQSPPDECYNMQGSIVKSTSNNASQKGWTGRWLRLYTRRTISQGEAQILFL